MDFWPELRAPDKILGVLGPKKFCMLWRTTHKQIFRKRSLEKYNFRSPPPNPHPLTPAPLSGDLELPKNCWILFEILTSDDNMQADATDVLQILLN